MHVRPARTAERLRARVIGGHRLLVMTGKSRQDANRRRRTRGFRGPRLGRQASFSRRGRRKVRASRHRRPKWGGRGIGKRLVQGRREWSSLDTPGPEWDFLQRARCWRAARLRHRGNNLRPRQRIRARVRLTGCPHRQGGQSQPRGDEPAPEPALDSGHGTVLVRGSDQPPATSGAGSIRRRRTGERERRPTSPGRHRWAG